MPYIGESHRLFWGSNLGSDGWTDFDDWYYRLDGATHTLTAGHDVLVAGWWDGVYSTEFEADETALARWVIVVSGGSGTLQLDGGADPDFNYDDPSLATQNLGAFTITGATEIVTDELASLTHADLVEFNAGALLRIRCTSGSVTISQVKLRTWGEDAPGGAWTTGSEFEMTNQSARVLQASTGYVTVSEVPTEAEAWTELRALIDAEEGQDRTYSAASGSLGVAGSDFNTHTNFVSLIGFDGQAQFTVIEVSATPIALYWYTVAGTHPAAGVDPREVQQEPISGARTLDGEWAYANWTSWYDNVRITATLAGKRIAYKTIPMPDYYLGGSFTKPIDVPIDGSWFVDVAGDGMDAPSAPAFAFTTLEDTYLSPIGGVAGSQASVPRPAKYNALATGYQWFDPTLPWVPDVEYPEERVFIQDWDGTYYPVGMGKPAGMFKVMRIWTPEGMYRDLTYTEYFAIASGESPPPGAVEFYVKQYDQSAGQLYSIGTYPDDDRLELAGWLVRAPEDDP